MPRSRRREAADSVVKNDVTIPMNHAIGARLS